MKYQDELYTILEHCNILNIFDDQDHIDLNKLGILLHERYPGKFHLEWATSRHLEMFDEIDVNLIKVVFHTLEEHVEWVLKYG
jgi:hypothetical protein